MAPNQLLQDMKDTAHSTAAASDYDPHIFGLRQSTWIKTRSADAGIKQGLKSLGHGLMRGAFTLTCMRILGGPESPCSDGLYELLFKCCTADTVIREIFQKQRFQNLQIKDLAKASKLRDQLFMFVAGIWLQTFSFKTICEWIDGVFDPLIRAAVVKFNEQRVSSPPSRFFLIHFQTIFSAAAAVGFGHGRAPTF
ncbi:hypothetical protein R3P38DRAFT_2819557 [Favolaschia claudopus]|uniref:Uncharacterized protein n=1 Tax=Favolaschia claudopus TaxID=2862362 RepID=A0AAW0EHV7_9AGAR